MIVLIIVTFLIVRLKSLACVLQHELRFVVKSTNHFLLHLRVFDKTVSQTASSAA